MRGYSQLRQGINARGRSEVRCVPVTALLRKQAPKETHSMALCCPTLQPLVSSSCRETPSLDLQERSLLLCRRALMLTGVRRHRGPGLLPCLTPCAPCLSPCLTCVCMLK